MPADAATCLRSPNACGVKHMWMPVAGRPATGATARTQHRSETRKAIGRAAPDGKSTDTTPRNGWQSDEDTLWASCVALE